MICFVVFGSAVGLNLFTLNDYSIQFLFYFIYVNLQNSLVFLGAACFSNVKTAPATNPRFPGRLVAEDCNPGRHVARDTLKGKARQGYFPERLGRAHIVPVKFISATLDAFPGRHVARESGLIKKN
nr:ABC transporter A family member 7-like [Tanacetum cinerariifolium]